MKKINLKLATALLCGTMLFSSCVGSFSLFNRVAQWNNSLGDKFVNELVFLALNIVPVYGVAYVADALVINSIEFWSGSNPMANIGTVKTVKGHDGNYLVETNKDGYTITKKGEKNSINLVHDEKTNTWNVEEQGKTSKLLKMNDDGTAEMYLPDGKTKTVTLDARGIFSARNITTTNGLFFATR